MNLKGKPYGLTKRERRFGIAAVSVVLIGVSAFALFTSMGVRSTLSTC